MSRNKIKKTTKSFGFTLIELLVVISIFSLLSSVVMTSFTSARAKARDARRIADARHLLDALAIEYSNLGKFPCYGPTFDTSVKSDGTRNNNFMKFLVNHKILATTPVDPSNNSTYHYSYITFKTSPTGPCGQVAYIDYTTEKPITRCIGNGVLFNNNHCHIFFPNPPNCPNWTDSDLQNCINYTDTVKEYSSP